MPLLWREVDALQIGLDTTHPVVVTGADSTHLRWVQGLDGLTPTTTQLARLASMRRPVRDGEMLLRALLLARALDDGPDPAALVIDDPAERTRLAPEAVAAALARHHPGAGAETMRRRRHACVAIRGANALGTAVATALAGAGVGRLAVARLPGDPPRPVSVDLGIASAVGAVRAAAAEAGGADVGATARDADLVLVAVTGVLQPDLADDLVAEGRPHLVCGVDGPCGSVGPLVLPGVTACLRCLGAHRTDRDPQWPRLVVQLKGRRRAPAPALDATLTVATGALAALHALAFLERRPGEPLPPSASGMVEMRLPLVWWSHRIVRRHPSCGCGDGLDATD